MSEQTAPLTLKQRLAQKPRKLISTVNIDGETVDLRRPSQGERAAVLAAAEEAGEITSEGKPTSPSNGVRLIARLFAASAHEPATGARIYDPTNPEDVAAVAVAPWLEEVQNDVVKAFHPNLEEAKGNS